MVLPQKSEGEPTPTVYGEIAMHSINLSNYN